MKLIALTAVAVILAAPAFALADRGSGSPTGSNSGGGSCCSTIDYEGPRPRPDYIGRSDTGDTDRPGDTRAERREGDRQAGRAAQRREARQEAARDRRERASRR